MPPKPTLEFPAKIDSNRAPENAHYLGASSAAYLSSENTKEEQKKSKILKLTAALLSLFDYELNIYDLDAESFVGHANEIINTLRLLAELIKDRSWEEPTKAQLMKQLTLIYSALRVHGWVTLGNLSFKTGSEEDFKRFSDTLEGKAPVRQQEQYVPPQKVTQELLSQLQRAFQKNPSNQANPSASGELQKAIPPLLKTPSSIIVPPLSLKAEAGAAALPSPSRARGNLILSIPPLVDDIAKLKSVNKIQLKMVQTLSLNKEMLYQVFPGIGTIFHAAALHPRVEIMQGLISFLDRSQAEKILNAPVELYNHLYLGWNALAIALDKENEGAALALIRAGAKPIYPMKDVKRYENGLKKITNEELSAALSTVCPLMARGQASPAKLVEKESKKRKHPSSNPPVEKMDDELFDGLEKTATAGEGIKKPSTTAAAAGFANPIKEPDVDAEKSTAKRHKKEIAVVATISNIASNKMTKDNSPGTNSSRPDKSILAPRPPSPYSPSSDEENFSDYNSESSKEKEIDKEEGSIRSAHTPPPVPPLPLGHSQAPSFPAPFQMPAEASGCGEIVSALVSQARFRQLIHHQAQKKVYEANARLEEARAFLHRANQEVSRANANLLEATRNIQKGAIHMSNTNPPLVVSYRDLPESELPEPHVTFSINILQSYINSLAKTPAANCPNKDSSCFHRTICYPGIFSIPQPAVVSSYAAQPQQRISIPPAATAASSKGQPTTNLPFYSMVPLTLPPAAQRRDLAGGQSSSNLPAQSCRSQPQGAPTQINPRIGAWMPHSGGPFGRTPIRTSQMPARAPIASALVRGSIFSPHLPVAVPQSRSSVPEFNPQRRG